MDCKKNFSWNSPMGAGSRMVSGLGMVVLSCCGAMAASPSLAPKTFQVSSQYTTEERTRVVAFWADPSRYSVGQPVASASRGSWQVRLTPEGSQWIWNLYKGKKTAASLVGGSSAPVSSSSDWDAWILKKVRHDRWQALQAARSANGLALGLPAADRDTPEVEPDVPGPIPDSLAAINGVPPSFAHAVQPKQFTVSFDDVVLHYEDNVKLSNPRYAYFRSTDGVMSAGVALKNFAPDRLQRVLDLSGCDVSRSKVLRAVSQLEGGFDSVNTYDTGFVSAGFIQFASLKEGSGALGAMLQLYKITDSVDFNNDFHRFGVDVQQDGSLDVVDPSTGNEIFGPDANAKIIQDKRLIAVFQRAGQLSDAYCATQVKAALSQFYPYDDRFSITTADGCTLCGKVGDVIRSEAGMATLFDRKVNTGNINALAKISSQVAAEHHCQTLSDLAKYEKEIVNGMKYRLDFTQDLTLSQPTGSR